MGSDFPVPRSLLPRILVTPAEHAARRAQMDRMLHNALDEYERFRRLDHGRVDPTRWKLSASKDALRLYRERKIGSSGFKTGSSMSDEDTTSQSGTNDYWEDLALDARGTNGRQRVKSMLMVGDMPGRADDAVYAVLATSNTELALVHTFLHDDAADSRLLHVLEGPTPDRPLHSLAYKWFVKRAPGGGRIIKHRDVLSLEYTGMTTTRKGERIGFLFIESVDLPGFPDMKDRNCLRAVQSVCALLRQKRDGLVEIFMTGVVELSGNFIRPLSSMLTAQSMFIVTKVMELAECKRITKCFVRQHQVRADRLAKSKIKPTACEICHQKPGFFKRVSLASCRVCGETICSQCQSNKRVFVAEGKLGRYERVACCMSCVFFTKSTREPRSSSRVPIVVGLSTRPSSTGSARSSRVSRSRPPNAGVFRHESQRLQPLIEEDHPVQHDRNGRALREKAHEVMLLTASNLGPLESHPQLERHGSSESRAQYPDSSSTETAPVLRPPSSVSTVTVSAPGGTYGRARGLPPQVRESQGGGASRQELYIRILELRRLAEFSYRTTEQNRIMMQQQGVDTW